MNPIKRFFRRDAAPAPSPGLREIRLKAPTVDMDARTVSASLSSELSVNRWFGDEVLRHDEASIDLTRAADGLPLLFGHDTRDFLGEVRQIRLQDRRLVGTLHFSRSIRATDVLRDINDGLLKNLSIGYDIRDAIETKSGIEATCWTPLEISIAPVPADPSIGIGREYTYVQRNADMQRFTRTKPTKESPPLTSPAEPSPVATGGDTETPLADLRELFREHTTPRQVALMWRMYDEKRDINYARQALLDLIGSEQEPATPAPGVASARAEGPSLADRMGESIRVRAGIEKDKDVLKHCRDHNEFGGQSLVEMARGWLRSEGINSKGGSREVVGRAFSTRADTGDFGEILANVGFKSLLTAYWDAPETWRAWARVTSLQDFKENHRVNLSEFTSLPEVPEGGTYTEGTFSDLGERIQLATYGALWVITRNAIINDDLSAFTRVPTAMGLAAARAVGDLAYGVLTSNPTMNQDATTLFNVAHNNDVADGGPPDMDSVQAAKVAMALQQGPQNEATLGIRPAFGICPVGLEGVFSQLMAAQFNPAQVLGGQDPNIVQNLLTVVSDHRLDTHNPLQWYVAANTNSWDTVEMAFLDGNQQPYQERRNDDISTDNITYKVRIDAAAGAMDFRGLYRNAGETA